MSQVLVAAALALYGGLAVSSLRVKSATFDESKHLPAGYMFLRYGDFRLDPDNPALARMVAATPLLFMDVSVDRRDVTWRESRVWLFGHRFLYEWNDPDRLLFRGRIPIVMLGALLAWAVFRWTRTHWGLPAAGLALFLCALNPDVLAHGRLATTDLAIALFFFLSVVAFERLTDRVTWARLVLTGVCVGCAFATKFSAVILLPILGILALAVALSPQPLRLALRGLPRAPGSLTTRRRRLAAAGLLLAAIGGIAVVVIWAVYRFRFAPSPGPDAAGVLDWGKLRLGGGLLDGVILGVRDARLLPEAYLYGFVDMLRRGQRHLGFLLGQHSSQGLWYYFPVTFALKTPLPLIVLLGVALATFRRRLSSWRVELFVWLPPALYLLAAMSHRLNIGHRHLLPIYPFLFVAAGRCAVRLGEGRRPAIRKIAMVLLAGWYAFGTMRIHPDYLAYFNGLIGGPANGYRHLVDSNLDWGQDLKQLHAYIEEEGHSDLKLSYFGTADPDAYGMKYELLPSDMRPLPVEFGVVVRPGDLVAVSATNLQGVYLPRAVWPLMERFRGLRPIATIGHSIFVYRADFTWILGPAQARRVGWLPQAMRSYLAEARRDPRFADGFGRLGTALHLLGRNREALKAFERALSIDPRYFESRPEDRRAWAASRQAPGETTGVAPRDPPGEGNPAGGTSRDQQQPWSGAQQLGD